MIKLPGPAGLRFAGLPIRGRGDEYATIGCLRPGFGWLEPRADVSGPRLAGYRDK